MTFTFSPDLSEQTRPTPQSPTPSFYFHEFRFSFQNFEATHDVKS